MARLVDCYPSSDDELPDVAPRAKKPSENVTQTPRAPARTMGAALIPKSTVKPSTRKVRRLGDFGKARDNPLFQKWDLDQDDTSRFGRQSPTKSPTKSRNTTQISFAGSESEMEHPQSRFRALHARRTPAKKTQVESDSDEDVFGRNGTPQIKVAGIEQDVAPITDATVVADDTRGTLLEAVSVSNSSASEITERSEEDLSETMSSNVSTSFGPSEKNSSGYRDASAAGSDSDSDFDSEKSVENLSPSPRKRLFANAATDAATNANSAIPVPDEKAEGAKVEAVAAQVTESLSDEEEWDPAKQLEEECSSRELRPSTPTGTPTKPSPPAEATSPSKHIRIPKTPHRPSTDMFWDQQFVNEWNEQHSPRKLILPLGNRSPNRQSPKKESRKGFDAAKHALAENFLCQLDAKITDGRISELAEATGGVKLIWTKTLNTTAGRANWKRETVRSKDTEDAQTTKHYKHHASIELAEKVIDDETRLLNVIAHEFCHLANFMVTGISNNPHGKEFKAWAAKCTRAFGDRGVQVTTKHSYDIDFKYIWECTECGSEYKRHSRSIDLNRHRCGSCKGSLKQTKPVPRKGAGKPSEYQIFVKEQMKIVKQENPGSPQKDVMRLIAEKWAKRSVDPTTVDNVVEQMVDLTLNGAA